MRRVAQVGSLCVLFALCLSSGTVAADGDDPPVSEIGPIKDRETEGGDLPQEPVVRQSANSRLEPEERPAAAKQALDPATGDRDRFQAVRSLAIREIPTP